VSMPSEESREDVWSYLTQPEAGGSASRKAKARHGLDALHFEVALLADSWQSSGRDGGTITDKA
jgi:hypothetical protein